MRSVSEKWQSLTNVLQKQNREVHVETFRNFLTTSHIVDKYFDIVEGAEDSLGLNRTERIIIYLILIKRDFMTPTEISKMTLRQVDTINKSVDGLNKKGLLRSYQSKTDRRLRKVILTEKSLEWVEQNLPVRELSLRMAMSCFSDHEAKIFDAFLKRLREQMINVINGKDHKSVKTYSSNMINDPFDNLSNTETQNCLKK